jgi:hypothetical protein
MQRKGAYTTVMQHYRIRVNATNKQNNRIINRRGKRTEEYYINIDIHRKRINTQESNQPEHEQESRHDTRTNKEEKNGKDNTVYQMCYITYNSNAFHYTWKLNKIILVTDCIINYKPEKTQRDITHVQKRG